MEPQDTALSLVRIAETQDLNEADTRHQLIDQVIHDVLAWPRTLVSCELSVRPGFADYVLKDHAGDPVMVVEAKRQDKYFEIPVASSSKPARFITVSALLTDEIVAAAMAQVRSYAYDLGCEFAAITNGSQWVLFKVFERKKNWKKLKAFVIESLSYFADEYANATALLAYESICRRGSLNQLLSSGYPLNRQIYYPKEHIQSYSRSVTANRYARYLRPIASRYFSDFENAEAKFLDECYVEVRESQRASEGLADIIRDSLTPYLESFGIQETEDTARGGRIGTRIAKSVKESRSEDVVVLFGGKGSGKSTFLRRLLLHNPPQFLRKHAVIAIVDLLRQPEELPGIENYIWKQLAGQLDTEVILKGERGNLLELFEDRFTVAIKQNLHGLDRDSNTYNIELNRLVQLWKDDAKYVANRLSRYQKRRHKGLVVVIDNTDQFGSEIQDYCFTLAKKIAYDLGCLTLISMREERFHQSRIHGTLDAFQNSGFHISSPLPEQVFSARIQYVIEVLQSPAVNEFVPTLHPDSDEREGLDRFFRILLNEFAKQEQSPLYRFLVACAHGNTRLALELFRGFLVSGYTNVDEMVSVDPLWTVNDHQVIRPLMTPDRFFYEESDSAIPNLFQIRSKTNGSHFTALRILQRVAIGVDTRNPHFVNIDELRDIIENHYGMKEDFEDSLDMLLRYVLVEANNRLDKYAEDVDSIRITQYGHYMLKAVVSTFSYLDLASVDCGVYSERINNDLTYLGNEDFRLFRAGEKVPRILKRLEKVKLFCQYLTEQENEEIDRVGVLEQDKIARQIADAFDAEAPNVERSAKRNASRRGGTTEY